MKLGIPRAFFYHTYGTLWDVFFSTLSVELVYSDETNAAIFSRGALLTQDEACLPAKVFTGHVDNLFGKCDYILIPYIKRALNAENYCVRFHGIVDCVKSAFPHAPILDFAVNKDITSEFTRIGKKLGAKSSSIHRALSLARLAQRVEDVQNMDRQATYLSTLDLKILICANSYVAHDPYFGENVAEIIRKNGASVLYSDYFDKAEALRFSTSLAPRLYWEENAKTIGAAAANLSKIDGIIILTAFPCASDALSNEMLVRRIKDKPTIQIVLDGNTADAGLVTRIESFIEILRGKKNAGKSKNILSSHG
jgi:predicted nucleotide-binding protein (sugar kinase/HSP70/actin superfamily)